MRTDVRQHRGTRAAAFAQVEVELGGMHALGMFIQLGAAGAAADAAHFRDLHQQAFRHAAQRIALRQRYPRLVGDVDDQGALVEGRQEGARQEGHAGRGDGATPPAATPSTR